MRGRVLSGALTAVRVARLDIVGVITLGMFTALGGGMIRDILLDALPPATFSDSRSRAVAALGPVAFVFGRGSTGWPLRSWASTPPGSACSPSAAC
ncbi:TRIC cation channel family protein [Nocardioides sp. CER19]|uniref:trimeric intracellular cation channel family protein n=1 Tax=Nocardioides sp. CER19 TaxID=3038538 RepID=UPI00244D43F0|nr:TRIC cation channel family protein [Nocardioides sp. CER19]MDH2415964.1 TRIC cation channel family protein [Nocardioides sp. CER19]